VNRLGRNLFESLRPAAEGEPAERPGPLVRAGAFAAVHPVAVAWFLAAAVAAISYRHLITASSLSGGSLAAFPSSPRGFFGEFVSGLRSTALGGTTAASPALPMLGVSSALAFANPALAQKVLLLALPILAAVGCYRALRSIPVLRVAAVLGAACYGLTPLVLWALSDGRLPELVFLSGLPWLAGRLIGFFGSSPPPRRVRWIVGAAVGLGALGCFFPGAFLAAGLVACVALVFPGGGGRAIGLGRAALAAAGAAVLAWPVATGIVGSSGRSLSNAVGTPSFAETLRLALGPAPGHWWVAFFLPIAAAMGLGFAAGRLRRPAARSALMAIAGVYLAWAAASGWLSPWFANPVAYAAVAAFGMASLAAMGVESVVEGILDRSFGLAQIGSAVLVGVLTIGLGGQVLQASRGAWEIGGGLRTSPAYAMVRTGSGEGDRVLWIGRRLGGEYPAPGGPPMGVAAAGPSSVRFAVTAPEGTSAYDTGRPLDGAGYARLSATISAIMSGPTRHAGSLLAPFGIQFVVARSGDLPPAVLARLDEQIDLIDSGTAGLVIYRDPIVVPAAAVITDPAWRAAAASNDLTATAALQDPGAIALHGSGSEFSGHVPAGRGLPAGSSVLLSQEFAGGWRLSAAGFRQAVTPKPAFGWATGFAYRPVGTFVVRYTGQTLRTVAVGLLALLWLAALWITRRPTREG